MNAIPETRRAH